MNNTLLFQKYEFLSNFFAKIEKTRFFVKNFLAPKITVRNRGYFFPDRCPVEEHSFQRFLKYLKNRAIFDFFFRLFLQSASLRRFSTHVAGNACRAIILFFLFQNPSPLKYKCGFLMRFFKKNRSMRPTHYATIFPIFVGGTASHGIPFSVLFR